MAEHWQLQPEVSCVQFPATAALFRSWLTLLIMSPAVRERGEIEERPTTRQPPTLTICPAQRIVRAGGCSVVVAQWQNTGCTSQVSWV